VMLKRKLTYKFDVQEELGSVISVYEIIHNSQIKGVLITPNLFERKCQQLKRQ
jgi:hypothetical protein